MEDPVKIRSELPAALVEQWDRTGGVVALLVGTVNLHSETRVFHCLVPPLEDEQPLDTATAASSRDDTRVSGSQALSSRLPSAPWLAEHCALVAMALPAGLRLLGLAVRHDCVTLEDAELWLWQCFGGSRRSHTRVAHCFLVRVRGPKRAHWGPIARYPLQQWPRCEAVPNVAWQRNLGSSLITFTARLRLDAVLPGEGVGSASTLTGSATPTHATATAAAATPPPTASTTTLGGPPTQCSPNPNPLLWDPMLPEPVGLPTPVLTGLSLWLDGVAFRYGSSLWSTHTHQALPTHLESHNATVSLQAVRVGCGGRSATTTATATTADSASPLPHAWRLRGSVCATAVAWPHDTVSHVVRLLHMDVIHSLVHRVGVANAEASDASVSSPSASVVRVCPDMPRRRIVCVETLHDGGGVIRLPYCDYLMTSDTLTTSNARMRYVLGINKSATLHPVALEADARLIVRPQRGHTHDPNASSPTPPPSTTTATPGLWEKWLPGVSSWHVVLLVVVVATLWKLQQYANE